VWERTQKLNIFSNYTVMLGCYARDSMSFMHSCDVWNCTQKLRVKTHTFKSGYLEKSVGTRSRPTTPLIK